MSTSQERRGRVLERKPSSLEDSFFAYCIRRPCALLTALCFALFVLSFTLAASCIPYYYHMLRTATMYIMVSSQVPDRGSGKSR